MNDLKIEVTDIALAIDSKIFKCLLEHCKEVISDNIKDLFERATILMRSETEYEPNIIISNLTHRDELEYLFEYTATKVFYSKLVDENTLMFLHYSEKACIGETFGFDFNLIHPENINIILCTREKLRLDKSIDINWVHALNIQLIFVTEEVSKFRK